MTLDEIIAGIRESIANARPDLKREQVGLLRELETGLKAGTVEKIMAALERLDIVDHYPAVQRDNGRLDPQPMPGGWTSWYGWMTQLKAFEATPYTERQKVLARPDIAETGQR